MHVGQKVMYRLVPASQRAGDALYVEATVLALDLPANLTVHDGQQIGRGGPILIHTPDREHAYRRLHDGRDLTDWDVFVEAHAARHIYQQRIRPGDTVALVSDVLWYPEGADMDGRSGFSAKDYSDRFHWEKVTYVARDSGGATVQYANGNAAEVAAIHLYGAQWIESQEQKQKYRQEVAERKVRAHEVADRLGLPPTVVELAWGSAPTLKLSVNALVGLIERAHDDPEWYGRLVDEGILGAMGGAL